ncbi:MAG: 16S rRNA (cytosine(967)-C(5))-methyltransferase [Paenibacillaceae bacterium ZCTH02-B3]|nr:MAG: 16S rRNA (cytosine(967)-C(5))-methyltransferase [Paenibacillaceae bacterium ZCTH02-B3]
MDQSRKGKRGKDGPGRAGPEGPREVAWRVLMRVEEGAFSGLELGHALERAGLSREDAALATEIVYGTIQRLNTIDWVLAGRVRGWPDRIEPGVRALLRLSYYQLRWLNRVPPYAAVNEAVRLARKHCHPGVAGLVNAVLRGLLRDGVAPPLPEGLSDAERIALEHSHPLWLVERWIAAYGADTAEAVCRANNEPPRQSARVNPLRATRDRLLEDMREAGLDARPSLLSEAGVTAARGGNLAATPWFSAGLITVQDESSMLVAAVADPRPGSVAVDCCAAPGGKATHLAELMEDCGHVIANDAHPRKAELIRRHAERLGLSCIRVMTGDAADLPERLGAETADAVLLDAPCSGLGVIRRKPEIKWNKSERDIAALAELQASLLDRVQALVKPGGVLVYSTCTIAREENEDNVRRFLNRHPAFSLDPAWPESVLGPLRKAGLAADPFPGMVQLLPHHFGSDGFFIARFRREGRL